MSTKSITNACVIRFVQKYKYMSRNQYKEKVREFRWRSKKKKKESFDLDIWIACSPSQQNSVENLPHADSFYYSFCNGIRSFVLNPYTNEMTHHIVQK